jgi:hypothetical protein
MVNKEIVELPVSLNPGMYIEFIRGNEGRVFDENGNFINNVSIPNLPLLEHGSNTIDFLQDKMSGNARLQIFIRTESEPIN